MSFELTVGPDADNEHDDSQVVIAARTLFERKMQLLKEKSRGFS